MHMPTSEIMSVYDAAMRYMDDGVPLVVLAGKEYGTGSSRDWAAKGSALLGVRAVLAQSYERIHRSNLIGMSVLPLQFVDGANAESLGLSGHETFAIRGIGESEIEPGGTARVVASLDGKDIAFDTLIRLDTAVEVDYYKHGGILPYVLRQMVTE